MVTFDGFHAGDKVAHITVGDGVVTAVEDGCVVVTFQRRDRHERPVVGRYDRRWFEINPAFLFHRFSQRKG